MHEMSLAMGIVGEVERCLGDFGPTARATRVTIQVGRFRAVVREAMEFCFLAASRGTRAEGAELVVEEIPLVVHCATCDEQWTLEEVAFFCPRCDQAVTLVSGKELLLRTIEIDEETDEEDDQ